MRVSVDSLPAGFSCSTEERGKAVVTWGPDEARRSVSVQIVEGQIILYSDRSYKHADLIKALDEAG